MNTTNTTSARTPTSSNTTRAGCSAPSAAAPPLAQLTTPLYRELTEVGIRDRMPANRMMEMPLPMPNSVTCSPIHMTKEEPAMKDTTMTSAGQMPVASDASRL